MLSAETSLSPLRWILPVREATNDENATPATTPANGDRLAAEDASSPSLNNKKKVAGPSKHTNHASPPRSPLAQLSLRAPNAPCSPSLVRASVQTLERRKSSGKSSVFGSWSSPAASRIATASPSKIAASQIQAGNGDTSLHACVRCLKLGDEIKQLEYELVNSNDDVAEFQKRYDFIQSEGVRLHEVYELKCIRLREVIAGNERLENTNVALVIGI